MDCAIETEPRVLIRTDWRGYQLILEAVGEQRGGLRLTYDAGRLEIMTTSHRHEYRKCILATLLECLMVELGLDYVPGGSQTFAREDLDKGFEPDACYWIQNWRAVIGMEEHDPAVHPPPDLAIEVEVSRGILSRIGIYRAMKVPEIWRWTAKEELHVLVLSEEGEYVEQASSPTCPGFDPQALVEYVRRANEQPTSQVVRALRDRLRPQGR